MITVSVSDIQKNPKVLSQSDVPVTIYDKRKNINLGVFYPKSRIKNSVEDLAWSLWKYIPEEKKNIPFEIVRSETQKMKVWELAKKYNLK